jgi:hypothetical protein
MDDFFRKNEYGHGKLRDHCTCIDQKLYDAVYMYCTMQFIRWTSEEEPTSAEFLHTRMGHHKCPRKIQTRERSIIVLASTRCSNSIKSGHLH